MRQGRRSRRPPLRVSRGTTVGSGGAAGPAIPGHQTQTEQRSAKDGQGSWLWNLGEIPRNGTHQGIAGHRLKVEEFEPRRKRIDINSSKPISPGSYFPSEVAELEPKTRQLSPPVAHGTAVQPVPARPW